MTKNVLDLLKREFNSPDLTKKIIAWLQEELESSRQIIAEYTDENRPKCIDGSDDFIEGNYNTAQRLLLQIEEWDN